jgi:hypothetical protein
MIQVTELLKRKTNKLEDRLEAAEAQIIRFTADKPRGTSSAAVVVRDEGTNRGLVKERYSNRVGQTL